MAQDVLNTKIAKANADVKKLCEFLVARRDWQVAREARPIVDELRSAANAVCVRVDRLLEGAEVGAGVLRTPEVEPLGPGAHDGARLQRFATFLRDLEGWFAAQRRPPTDPGSIALLDEIRSLASCLVALFAEEVAEPIATEPSPKPRHEPSDAPRQLVLDHTEHRPLVQEFQNIKELTPACEKLADDFLTAWGIELSYYKRKKFLERLLRWISSAPEGQVLVIKMKTAEEPYEPYPSYVSRELLAAKQQPPKD